MKLLIKTEPKENYLIVVILVFVVVIIFLFSGKEATYKDESKQEVHVGK